MKMACIEFTPDTLVEALPMLINSGLTLVGSLDCGSKRAGHVRIAFAGDILPEECTVKENERIRFVTVFVDAHKIGSEYIYTVNHFEAGNQIMPEGLES